VAAGIEESRTYVPRAPVAVMTGGKTVTHLTGSSGIRMGKLDFSAPPTSQKQSRSEGKRGMLLRLFAPDAILARFKIQQYCERILAHLEADSIDYSRRAEDILWRKCFYEVILLARKNLKYVKPESELEDRLRLHLAAANGFYHSLLLKMQNMANVHLENQLALDAPVSKPGSDKTTREGETEDEKDMNIWFLKCIHRCLSHLGDLARYQQDFDGTKSRVVAARYYGQALQFLPELGLPHNQLGTLAGLTNYGLDAAYHYLRCLLTPVPFQGAAANLDRLFDRNHRRHMEIIRSVTKGDMNLGEFLGLRGFGE